MIHEYFKRCLKFISNDVYPAQKLMFAFIGKILIFVMFLGIVFLNYIIFFCTESKLKISYYTSILEINDIPF